MSAGNARSRDGDASRPCSEKPDPHRSPSLAGRAFRCLQTTKYAASSLRWGLRVICRLPIDEKIGPRFLQEISMGVIPLLAGHYESRIALSSWWQLTGGKQDSFGGLDIVIQQVIFHNRLPTQNAYASKKIPRLRPWDFSSGFFGRLAINTPRHPS